MGYFGKRDLADLTETIMGDVNRMEHVWSHVLGYLYGAYISTAIIALCLLSLIWGIYSEVKYMRNHSRKAAAAN